MCQVCKFWRSIAACESLWKQKCFVSWPRVFHCIEALKQVVGDYFTTFKVWRSIEVNDRLMYGNFGFRQRFSFDDLHIYLEFRFKQQVVWGQVQNARAMFVDGQSVPFEGVTPIICSTLDSICEDFSLRIVFFLKHRECPQIFVSIRHLSLAMISLSAEQIPNLILKSVAIEEDFSFEQSKFVGVIRFRVTEGQLPLETAPALDTQFRFSFYGFMTYLMTPVHPTARRRQQKLKPRQILTLLKNYLLWSPGPQLR